MTLLQELFNRNKRPEKKPSAFSAFAQKSEPATPVEKKRRQSFKLAKRGEIKNPTLRDMGRSIRDRFSNREPDSPLVQKRAERAAGRQQTADKITSREMTRDEYQQQRAREREKISNPTGSATTRLVPLAQEDEIKVRQMLQRLTPAHAEEFANRMGEVAARVIQGKVDPKEKEAANESIGTFKDFLFERLASGGQVLKPGEKYRASPEDKLAQKERRAAQNVEAGSAASERALQTLLTWGKQLSGNPGKLGTLLTIAFAELDFPNDESRREFRKGIENTYGRFVAQAKDKPVKRMTKRAVKQRGREAGADPRFKTRAEQRAFIKDQNIFRKTRKAADAGKGAEDRWRAPAA